MDKIIEFIISNYVWFIVIAVIIIMAIIGYIADKTEFGKNKEKKEEQNNEIPQNILENESALINQNNNVSNESIVEIKPQAEDTIDPSLFVPLSNNEQDQPVYIEPSQNVNTEQNDENNNDIWQF